MINSSMFGDFYLYNSLNTEERFYRSIPMSAENIHTTKFIQQQKLFCRYFFLFVLYASPHVRESEFREFFAHRNRNVPFRKKFYPSRC